MPPYFLALLLLGVLVSCSERDTLARDSVSRVTRGETVAPQAAPIVPSSSKDTLAEATQQAAQPAQAQPGEAAAQHPIRRRALSPGAQAIAERMVFVPRNRAWFVAAVRAKRLLVDIGRYDGVMAKDSVTRTLFGEAATRLTPLPAGTPLRLTGTWGAHVATVSGFDVWNGRIVATLALPSELDSLVRRDYQLPGAALRVDTLALATRDSAARDSAARGSAATPRGRRDPRQRNAAGPGCERDSIPVPLAERVAMVRDSMMRWVTDSVRPAYPRLEVNAKTVSYALTGCFGLGRVVVFAARRNPSLEYAAERAAIVNDSGAVVRLRVADLRFRVHEVLGAFDADGDGIDDVASRSLGERSGGLTILRVDTTAKRLERLAAGFSWEAR